MTKEELLNFCKEWVNYDPATGIFTWEKNRSGKCKKGNVIGYKDDNGYIKLGLNRKIYFGHRLAYLIMTGDWPKHIVDHIDNNPSNNAWDNLRESTPEQNSHNRRLPKDNKSGVAGIIWHKQAGKWLAKPSIGGEAKSLGLYDSIEEATEVVVKAKEDYRNKLYSGDIKYNSKPKQSRMSEEELREYLDEWYVYDPLNGLLSLKKSRRNYKEGYVLGTKNGAGYISVHLKRKPYLVHRLAFFIMEGYFPEVVDHINGDRSDNRWCNLRAITYKDNALNQAASNKIGIKGVSFRANRYEVRVAGKYIGRYNTLQEAKEVSDRLHEELYGEYNRMTPSFIKGIGDNWLVKCSCGKWKTIKEIDIRDGKVSKCTCAINKYSDDVTGERFGKLTAISPIDKQYHGNVYWEFKCDCGESCIATLKTIKEDSKQDCGCESFRIK